MTARRRLLASGLTLALGAGLLVALEPIASAALRTTIQAANDRGQRSPSDPTNGGRVTPVEPNHTGPLPGISFPGNAPTAIQLPFVLPEVPLGVVGTYNFEEPLIKVSPINPNNVVLTSHRGMRITTDGGLTFGPLITFPNVGIGNNGDTAMDFDSQGRLFWANLTGAPGHNQITQMDPLTGAQIGATVDVAVSAGVGGTSGDDKEFIAADPYPASPYTDNLYMIWTRFPGGPAEVFFSRSTDQGVTWSTPLQLSASAAEGFPWPADVGVAPNGDVYASYHAGGSSGAVGTTWVLRSTDGGVTFPQKTLAFTAGQSDVTANIQSAAGTVPNTQFWMQGSFQPWVLSDPTRPGNVYVVNNDDPDNIHGAGDDADVVISRSTDNGLTWTVSTIPDGSGGAHQLFPFAAIDEGTGTIAVAWYDTRRALTNANGNFLLDVFVTFSTDGGLTWAPAFMVNDPANPFDPDFPGNQRRFPEPQVTPCNATAGSTETCRIGEYFGIDIRGSAIHLDWIGNLRSGPGPGNVTGDQLYYSQIQLLPVTGGGGGGGATLTTAVVGAGTITSDPFGISCPPDCSERSPSTADASAEDAAADTYYVLTATPAPGSVFTAWYGACAGTTTNICHLFMSSDTFVAAWFDLAGSPSPSPSPSPTPPPTPGTFDLHVSKTGKGRVMSASAEINCGTACTATFEEGTSVALTASPQQGWILKRWRYGCSGSELVCTLEMSSNRRAKAVFVRG